MSFHYGDHQLINDVSLKLTPGKILGITGKNGCGKSTITKLIHGFYAPEKGTLLVEGEPYENVDIVHLRKQVGMVNQLPLLFPGTIIENLVYGNQSSEVDEVIEASKLATAHQFIEQLLSLIHI